MGSTGEVAWRKGTLQLKFSCSASKEPEELGLLGEQREKSAGRLSSLLAGMACS